MNSFEYASPRSEAEALELLNDSDLPGKAPRPRYWPAEPISSRCCSAGSFRRVASST